MILSTLQRLHAVLIWSLLMVSTAAQDCSSSMKCHYITSDPPQLDADLSDWSNAMDDFTTPLVKIGSGEEYEAGNATLTCQYDSTRIYFALQVPGRYRFSPESDQLCASMGAMFQIGPKATFENMGGCPDAVAGCPDGLPDTCDGYRVDIGAHWKLKDTSPNTLYGVSSRRNLHGEENSDGTKPGHDPISNLDDEYAVSPHCRFDDDGSQAANEWLGAWGHTNPIEGESGVYRFELSNTLKSPSAKTDAQMSPGETVRFGVAFWDPYETEESGWISMSHYVTGCGSKWIELELIEGPEALNSQSNSAAIKTSSLFRVALTTVVSILALVGQSIVPDVTKMLI